MDVVTLGMAKSQLSRVVGTSSTLITTLRRDRRDAVMTLLGDSTGVPQGAGDMRWYYALTQFLAGQFPAYTVKHVLWDDTLQAYGTPTVIQTGTGSHTLTCYNASVVGQGYDYAFANTNLTRFNAIFAATPDAVLASYGYNAGTTTYKAETTTTARWVLGTFPNADYILVAQPPKATANADSANSLLRSNDVRQVALQNGYGLIDAGKAFLDYGNFDALINGDTIHPTPQGQAMWAAEAYKVFDPTIPVARPQAPGPSVDRLWFPASIFVPEIGAPSLSCSPSGVPKWNFGPDTVQSVVATLDIPPRWDTVNVHLYSSCPGGASGNISWYVDQQIVGNVIAVPTSGAVPPGWTLGNKKLLAGTPASTTITTPIVNPPVRFSEGRPLAFRIRRDGADVADTYPAQAWAYGILIERAS